MYRKTTKKSSICKKLFFHFLIRNTLLVNEKGALSRAPFRSMDIGLNRYLKTSYSPNTA